jgi:hypothetical protein
MRIRTEFERLTGLCGPLWAGEAEVARTYFSSPDRTSESDRKWIAHQCYKEFWGSGFTDPKLGLIGEITEKIRDRLPEIDKTVDRYEILDMLDMIHTEFDHYCHFAEVWDALRAPGEAKLNPSMLKNWPEGNALDTYRVNVRAEHGELGWTSLRFTEGGYCTLYSEGAKLRGRDGIDGQIGEACAKVYDDEVGHMLKGMAALNQHEFDADQWAVLERLTIDQLRLRVHMRNGQFGNPLSEERITAIFAGDIEPIAFDYGLADAAA